MKLSPYYREGDKKCIGWVDRDKGVFIRLQKRPNAHFYSVPWEIVYRELRITKVYVVALTASTGVETPRVICTDLTKANRQWKSHARPKNYPGTWPRILDWKPVSGQERDEVLVALQEVEPFVI
ncbi:hypothetical protein [Calderihabitans maritimus]|uniref:Uncharacterized protein n=1 Tax=Calderihabitans maritimus TaxID=1246530 RepID=A0A1Z5HYG5_9FIRM|nr:hypothetical protein [Calderihabitans maritimus]GAW94371.1 hypothetical protein KKC1_34770 [Calderihabitans maritimus]